MRSRTSIASLASVVSHENMQTLLECPHLTPRKRAAAAEGTTGCLGTGAATGAGGGGSRSWRSLTALVMFVTVSYVAFWLLSARQSYRDASTSARFTEQVTVVLNTFKRPTMLEDAIEFYGTCNTVKYIYVVWCEKDPPPVHVLNRYKDRHHPAVSFVQHPTDSLNNRFKPLEGPHTDAIFSVDDDIRVTCDDLTLAYEVWKGSDKSIVGFMPRLHLRGLNDQLVYRCWWRVWLHGAYSVILTKAAFLHHDYFKAYTTDMPAAIRDMVDRERNCEDIAMQFLISDRTQLPPVYVKGSLRDLGVLNGISTSKAIVSAGHMDRRSACLNDLVAMYQRNPLVRSHQIVYSASNGWANAPSTWAEYISSDLWKL